MDHGESSNPGTSRHYHNKHEGMRCFLGLSHRTRLFDDIVSMSKELLPVFGLDPWSADAHFDPETPLLLDGVIQMIADAPFGIYDLSFWRKDANSGWEMPRNVLIELGIAIGLNRPMLLLQDAECISSGQKLPDWLQNIRDHVISFTGVRSLKEIFKQYLPQLKKESSEQEWVKRHCFFGNRTCEYREIHPFARNWATENLLCFISDGQDIDRLDIREVIEEVFGQYRELAWRYSDELPLPGGYNFHLCAYCQGVRSMPLAIYRITGETPAETFIALGISLALEMQFNCKIPRLLLTRDIQDLPSLLVGYKVVVAQNSTQWKEELKGLLPQLYRHVRDTRMKSRPLPFIPSLRLQGEKPKTNDIAGSTTTAISDESGSQESSSNSLTLALMAGLPGSGKRSLARALGKELGWLVIDKDGLKEQLLRDGLNDYDAGFQAYEYTFETVRQELKNKRSVILDTAALHPFILEKAQEIVSDMVPVRVRLKVLFLVTDREVRNERIQYQPPQTTVIRVDPRTVAEYLDCFGHLPLPPGSFYLDTSMQRLQDYLPRASYYLTTDDAKYDDDEEMLRSKVGPLELSKVG